MAEGVHDLTTVDRLDESALLKILGERYGTDTCYTYIGPILVAINPLKDLPIYGEAQATKYRKAASRSELPPHVYRIAHEAFTEMVDERMNQSVVVSGESGAGKTETTKHIIRLVSWASTAAIAAAANAAGVAAPASGSSVGAALEAKLLATNPILEALGNCRTTRNDNSSRFGKFVRLSCAGSGAITGCSVDTYLLEKSRVVSPSAGERNFHVYYQLLASGALSPELMTPGTEPSAYAYLKASGVYTIKGVDDKVHGERTTSALKAVGLGDEDVQLVLELLGATLLLGNVAFGESPAAAGSDHGDGSGAMVKDAAARAALAAAAKALGCDEAELEEGMTTKRLRAGAEWITKRHSVDEAVSARDALAKALYAALFDALVRKLNGSLGAHSASHSADGAAAGSAKKAGSMSRRASGANLGAGGANERVGVLDIFGFENFGVNSLEQLAINYANEKLQGLFNAIVFKAALDDFKREGVDVPAEMPYTDNTEVVAAIEARPSGLVWLLQDTCSMGKATDATFADEVAEKLRGSAALGRAKDGAKGGAAQATRTFTLRHYAGDVTYSVAGFLLKNKDPLNEDLSVAVSASTKPLVAALLQHGSAAGGKGFRGVLSKFYQQLDSLVRTLSTSKVTFVRCIKPNAAMAPNNFDKAYCKEQLAACGVLEAITITRAGYPERFLCAELAPQFGMLLHPKPLPPLNDEAMARVACEAIFKKGGLKKGEHYVLGTSKAFFRHGAFAKLREARRKKTIAYALVVQACARRMLAVRARRRKAIEAADAAAAKAAAEAAALAAKAAEEEAARAELSLTEGGYDEEELERIKQQQAKALELDQLRNPGAGGSALDSLATQQKRKSNLGAARAAPRPTHVIGEEDEDVAGDGDDETGDGVNLSSAAMVAPASGLVSEGGSGKALAGAAAYDKGVLDYARYLGMDPDDPVDAGLLWIAEQALFAQVPEPWAEALDRRGHLYYYNEVTQQTLREHPLDEYHRQLYYRHRGQWDKSYWTPGAAADSTKDAHGRKRAAFDYYTQAGYYASTTEMAEAFLPDELPAVPQAGGDEGGSADGGGHQPPLPNECRARLVLDEAQPALAAQVASQQGMKGTGPGGRLTLADVPEPLSPFGPAHLWAGLTKILTEPAGRHAMVQCYVLREKEKGGAVRYDLYLELPPYHALYCMSAKKSRGARTTLYRFSTEREGAMAFEPSSRGYLGKLAAQDMGGLHWVLYTPGLSPRKADRYAGGAAAGGARNSRLSRMSNSGFDDDDDDTASVVGGPVSTELRAELLAIAFEQSILGSGGPVQLTAGLPAESDEGGRALLKPRTKEETLVERLKSQRYGGLVMMANKAPTWSERLQSYTLEYNGRATEPSVKNIQLVDSRDQHDIKFQLGKVGTHRFNVDYKRPYSAMQAFAIAVAVFDDKLLCSPAPPVLRSALSLKDKLLNRHG